MEAAELEVLRAQLDHNTTSLASRPSLVLSKISVRTRDVEAVLGEYLERCGEKGEFL